MILGAENGILQEEKGIDMPDDVCHVMSPKMCKNNSMCNNV